MSLFDPQHCRAEFRIQDDKLEVYRLINKPVVLLLPICRVVGGLRGIPSATGDTPPRQDGRCGGWYPEISGGTAGNRPARRRRANQDATGTIS